MKLLEILNTYLEEFEGPLSEDCVPCSAGKTNLKEVDFEDKFSDVKYSCITPEAIVKMLNAVLDGKKVDPEVAKKLEKKKKVGRRTASLMDPFIHRKAIPLDSKGGIDIDKFIEQITAEPLKLTGANGKMIKSSSPVTQNAKMGKSSSQGEIFFKVGVPSVKGLVYDIENKQFINVNTCPSAGECLLHCYTFVGGFIQYPATFLAQSRILNKLMNDPKGYEEMIYGELAQKCKTYNKKGIKVIFRWNDSGDFFSKEYFAIMKRISQRLLDEGYNFKSYIYTKNMALVLANKDSMPSNVKITFSQGADPIAKKLAQQWDGSRSHTIPSEIFKGKIVRVPSGEKDKDGKDINKWAYKSKSDLEAIKKDLSTKYNVPVENILTFDEMMEIPEGKELKWSVIVLPGEADNPATRDDVKNVFLAFH